MRDYNKRLLTKGSDEGSSGKLPEKVKLEVKNIEDVPN